MLDGLAQGTWAERTERSGGSGAAGSSWEPEGVPSSLAVRAAQVGAAPLPSRGCEEGGDPGTGTGEPLGLPGLGVSDMAGAQRTLAKVL